jgi:hypothetical protein
MKHSAINEARESARQLRRALLSGSLEDLGESIPALTGAVRNLQSLEKSLASQGDTTGDTTARTRLRRELIELRRDLDSAAWLVLNGAALQKGWARLLGAALGYTASGDAAPLPSAARVRVTG